MTIVAPRIAATAKVGRQKLAKAAVAWCREQKMGLDAEQEWMLEQSMRLTSSNRWQSFEVGLNAPRQNGKGEVLMARELFGLFVLRESLIVHSAHEFKTSSRHFKRIEQFITQRPELYDQLFKSPVGKQRVIGFKYTNGDESVELMDGCKIEFRTRTKAGMKGFDDVSLLVLDEAQILSEWAHGTMVPTLRASRAEHGPQLWYAGNAADQQRDHNAIVWTRLRERGIAGDDPGLVYFEWSLDFESPDDVPEDVARDPEMWKLANWAMSRCRPGEKLPRVTVEHMEKEIRTLGWRQFIVELLGVGDYPDTDVGANSVISSEVWDGAEDEQSQIEGEVCIAYDVSPGRRTTIAVCGLNGAGLKHVEVINSRAGTGWVPERIAELCERHDVVEIVCDGFGPGNTIANRIEEQTGLEVRRLKTGEYADACGLFADEIEEGRVVHIGQEELTTSVRGARTRPLVDRWAWSRSKSRTDSGPLIAVSLALWSAVDRDVGARKELMIF